MPTRLTAAHAAPFDLDVTAMPDGEFFTGERVCPPSRFVHRRNSWGSASLVLLLLGAGGIAIAKLPETWRTAIADEAQILAERAFAGSQPPPAQAPSPRAAKPEPLPQQDVAAAAGADAGTLVAEQPAQIKPEDAGSPQAATSEEAAPEPLAPPVADPADPLQKRALAAGLHPDVSRAVLARFSETDWRNAAYAVRTALTSPRDAGVTWPKNAVGNTAQFEVRFVRAAGDACRRYVVSVIKDRWSTTSPAMELCGDALPKREASHTSVNGRGG